MDNDLTLEELNIYIKYYLQGDLDGAHYWLSDSDIIAGNFDNIECFDNNITSKSYKDE